MCQILEKIGQVFFELRYTQKLTTKIGQGRQVQEHDCSRGWVANDRTDIMKSQSALFVHN